MLDSVALSNRPATAAAPLPPQARVLYSKGRIVITLLVLMALYAVNFVDRIIVAIAAEAIKLDLALTDAQLGMLGGLAFALVYGVTGIPLARLAERFNRVRLLAACAIFWSACTALCGAAHSFGAFLLCRMGVGAGESGCTPISHSIITDYVSPHRRATVLAIYALGIPIGALGGSFLIGWMISLHGWRSGFFLMGGVGVILSLVMYKVLKEPVRGGTEPVASEKDQSVPSLLSVVKHLLARRSALLIASGCVALSLGMFGINLFIPAFLVRTQGLDMATAGGLFGLISGISGVVGTTTGGFLADYLGRRDYRWYAWIPGIGALLATPLYLVAFTRPQLWQMITLMIVMSTLAQLWTGPTFAALHGMVRPRMRASTSALLLVLMAVIGNGMGPMLVGHLSDVLANRSFTLGGGVGDFATACTHLAVPASAPAECKVAGAAGITQALSYAGWIFLLGAILYFAAGRSLVADSAKNNAPGAGQ